jgi:Zn-dependent oligopeptidase
LNEQRKIFWGIETDQQIVLSLLDQQIHAIVDPTAMSTTDVLHQVQRDHSTFFFLFFSFFFFSVPRTKCSSLSTRDCFVVFFFFLFLVSFIVVVVVVGTIPYQKDMVTHARFTHFVGYGCGYYSYLYAKVVSAHLWSKIFQKNPLNRNAGELYRQSLLKYGGAKDPNLILHDILGEDEPNIDVLVDSFVELRRAD